MSPDPTHSIVVYSHTSLLMVLFFMNPDTVRDVGRVGTEVHSLYSGVGLESHFRQLHWDFTESDSKTRDLFISERRLLVG